MNICISKLLYDEEKVLDEDDGVYPAGVCEGGEEQGVAVRVGPRQNNDIRESENGQPWKNWNCQNHSQYCLIANFVHEIGNFAKNRKINVTINTNI